MCKQQVGEERRQSKMCWEGGRVSLTEPSIGHAGCCCMEIGLKGARVSVG